MSKMCRKCCLNSAPSPETLTNWRNVTPWYPARTMNAAVAPPANLQPPRRVRRCRRDNQATLIAWLDEQERLIRMRGIPTEVVREFDPLHNLPEPQGAEVEQGRRTIEFRFTENLEGPIADQTGQDCGACPIPLHAQAQRAS